MATHYHQWFYYSAGLAHGIKVGAKTMKTLNMLRNSRMERRPRKFFSQDGLVSGMLMGLAVSYGFLLFWLAVKEIWG